MIINTIIQATLNLTMISLILVGGYYIYLTYRTHKQLNKDFDDFVEKGTKLALSPLELSEYETANEKLEATILKGEYVNKMLRWVGGALMLLSFGSIYIRYI